MTAGLIITKMLLILFSGAVAIVLALFAGTFVAFCIKEAMSDVKNMKLWPKLAYKFRVTFLRPTVKIIKLLGHTMSPSDKPERSVYKASFGWGNEKGSLIVLAVWPTKNSIEFDPKAFYVDNQKQITNKRLLKAFIKAVLQHEDQNKKKLDEINEASKYKAFIEKAKF